MSGSLRHNTNRDGSTTNRGSNPKRGFPGKLHAARNHAPDAATEAAILDVASTALERGCHPREVWDERQNGKLSDYTGGGE